MRKETIKARLAIGTVLRNLGFKAGRKDGVFFCACHPSDKPTVIARHEHARANCSLPECGIKNADVLDVIRIVHNCDFRKALVLAERMLENQATDLSLWSGLTDEEKGSSEHDVIPALKPLLVSHDVWLDGLLGSLKAWAVDKYQIASLRRTHLAVPVSSERASFVFIPVNGGQDATFYKGKTRTLQWFRPPEGQARRLLLCPGEMEAMCMDAEIFRRGLSHEWEVLAATNDFRPFDRLPALFREIPLRRYDEIVGIAYNDDHSKLLRHELMSIFKDVLVDVGHVHFWALPLRVVNRDSFFAYVRQYRDTLPYPLNAEPVDAETGTAEPRKKGKAAVVPRLLAYSRQINGEEPETIDYLHSVLCQVAMPRKEIEARFYEHSNGGTLLRIEAGSLFDGHKLVDQPLPYGALPRLIMVYISTTAVANQSPVVDIGTSLSGFMKQLNLPTTGGATGRMGSFKKQLNALVASRFILGMRYDNSVVTVETKPFNKFLAWLNDTEEPMSVWPGYIHLSEEFYKSLTNHAVPLDPRSLAALAHSPLGMDIYTWMASRLCRIPQGQKLFMSWKVLQEQFSNEPVNARTFRRLFSKAMEDACKVYPEAQIELMTDARGYHVGYRFGCSKPPIIKQKPKQLNH